MEEIEKILRVELENAQTALDASRSGGTEISVVESSASETGQDKAAPKSAILEELENKKKELVCILLNFFDKWFLPFSHIFLL